MSVDESPNARMFVACRHKKLDDLAKALHDGADVSALYQPPVDNVDDQKQAAHIAANVGFADGLELLWLHGADIHAPEPRHGNTPLHLAVLEHHVDVARFLLDLGADPEVENSLGNSVLKVANFADKDKNSDKMVPLIESYRQLPKVKNLNDLTAPDELWKRDKLEGCRFDNPQTWRHFSDIAAHLAAKGAPITKALLMQPNAEGKSWLQVGTEHGAFPQIVQALNNANEQLDASDLLNEKGEPGAVLQQATQYRQAGALFGYENWRGKAVPDVKALAEALPPGGREQVKNFHQLRAQLHQDASMEKRTGMGR